MMSRLSWSRRPCRRPNHEARRFIAAGGADARAGARRTDASGQAAAQNLSNTSKRMSRLRAVRRARRSRSRHAQQSVVATMTTLRSLLPSTLSACQPRWHHHNRAPEAHSAVPPPAARQRAGCVSILRVRVSVGAAGVRPSRGTLPATCRCRILDRPFAETQRSRILQPMSAHRSYPCSCVQANLRDARSCLGLALPYAGAPNACQHDALECRSLRMQRSPRSPAQRWSQAAMGLPARLRSITNVKSAQIIRPSWHASFVTVWIACAKLQDTRRACQGRRGDLILHHGSAPCEVRSLELQMPRTGLLSSRSGGRDLEHAGDSLPPARTQAVCETFWRQPEGRQDAARGPA